MELSDQEESLESIILDNNSSQEELEERDDEYIGHEDQTELLLNCIKELSDNLNQLSLQNIFLRTRLRKESIIYFFTSQIEDSLAKEEYFSPIAKKSRSRIQESQLNV